MSDLSHYSDGETKTNPNTPPQPQPLPVDLASTAFMTITPLNPEARLEFSTVVEWTHEQEYRRLGEQGSVDNARFHARKYMHVHAEPALDADVARMLHQRETGQLSSSSPLSSPARETAASSPVATAAAAAAAAAVSIWTGFYYLHLDVPPHNPVRGWVAGRLRQHGNDQEAELNDVVLTLSRETSTDIRQTHAVLLLSDLGRIAVRAARRVVCEVDGVPVQRQIQPQAQDSSGRSGAGLGGGSRSNPAFHIWNDDVRLTLGRLTYSVNYIRQTTRGPNYKAQVAAYLQTNQNQGISPLWDQVFLSPTLDAGRRDEDGDNTSTNPSANHTVIMVGPWRLSGGTIGTGAHGRVSIGTDNYGVTVALKRFAIDNTKDKGSGTGVENRKRVIEEITALAHRHGEKRVLRLKEVLRDGIAGNGGRRAVDVWFVLEPPVPYTLDGVVAQLCAEQTPVERLTLTRHLLFDVLGALQFLHANRWFHADLKPNNIGVLNVPEALRAGGWRQGLQIVLLDMDEALRIPTGTEAGTVMLSGPAEAAGSGSAGTAVYMASPGYGGGTLNWLSPEREMTGLNHGSDIWCAGLLGMWLANGGTHPWKLSANPWRPGPVYEALRERFHARYADALGNMRQWEDRDLAEATMGMLRHAYTQQPEQRQWRLTAAEALALLGSGEAPLSVQQAAKRVRKY